LLLKRPPAPNSEDGEWIKVSGGRRKRRCLRNRSPASIQLHERLLETIDDVVDCVKRALDYNFRSVRSPIPDITHHVDTIEQGRVYDVSPPVGPYHVRVKSNGQETTTIELFMPGSMYSVPLRDSLAKCP
jgi:hypothetical protein